MTYRRNGFPAWAWILIVLAAIILVFVVWWAVAASTQERPTVVVPPEQQPAEQPPDQQPSQQPVVIERERPVNIYVEREQRQPRVYIVETDEEPPEARERLQRIDLPGRFRYQDRLWQPSNEAVNSDDVRLKDTGASVNGNIVYAEQDAEMPYDELYLETQPGSGVFIRYTQTG